MRLSPSYPSPQKRPGFPHLHLDCLLSSNKSHHAGSPTIFAGPLLPFCFYTLGLSWQPARFGEACHVTWHPANLLPSLVDTHRDRLPLVVLGVPFFNIDGTWLTRFTASYHRLPTRKKKRRKKRRIDYPNKLSRLTLKFGATVLFFCDEIYFLSTHVKPPLDIDGHRIYACTLQRRLPPF